MQRIRISIDAFNAQRSNYVVKMNEFDAVVDKCELLSSTDPAECTRVRHEV